MNLSKLLKTLKFGKKRQQTPYNHRQAPVFVHGSSTHQYSFAFPKHVNDYIIANPKSPKQWKKLIQTCKLWFDKNPIIVISCLHFACNQSNASTKGWRICSSSNCNGHADLAINLADAPFKLWITENLDVVRANLSQELIPYLYKCDVKKMNICGKVLSSDELLLLAPKIVDLRLFGVFENKNGENVSLEKIVEALPASLERIEYHIKKENITPDTFKKLSVMEHVRKLKEVKFFGYFYPSFDFDGLFKFMVDNKQIRFKLKFYVTPASDVYIDKIITLTEQLRDYGSYQYPKIRFIPVVA